MHDIDNKFPDRGVKEGPQLMVLRHTDMPAVLVECGFIDNAADAWLMVQYPADVAAAIARGITDYWCYRSDKRWP